MYGGSWVGRRPGDPHTEFGRKKETAVNSHSHTAELLRDSRDSSNQVMAKMSEGENVKVQLSLVLDEGHEVQHGRSF